MLKKSKPQSLESYLAQIAHELRALPAQARADEMREIEAHLGAMLEQRGDVATVLMQFGKPRKVGRDLRRAWERKQDEAWWRLPLAAVIGVGFPNFAWLTSAFVATGGKFYSLSFLNDYNAQLARFSGSNWFVWTPAMFFVSGVAMGAISPKYSRWMGWMFFLSCLVEMALQIRPDDDSFDFLFGPGTTKFFFVLMGLMSLVLSLPCFYGARIGARFSRNRDAKIADAK